MAAQRRAPGFESSPVAKLFSPELGRLANGRFGGLVGSREQAIECFERHNHEVKRYVPAERLLVYEVGQGWEPLCSFLGVPAPAGVPFPYLNDTEVFRARLESAALRT